MKKYYLRILYPSSNKWGSNQSYEEIIEASHMDYNSGSLFFMERTFITAVYPANYTIVYKIEDI
jgi:hypothetical protein